MLNGSEGGSAGDHFRLSQYTQSEQVQEHLTSSPAVRISSASAITRRNHGCVVRPVESELGFSVSRSPLEAILFGGRWGANIEVLDISSGEYSLKTPLQVPELDANHLSAEYVPSLYGGGHEIWIVCGFEGDVVNAETARTHMTIIDADTWEVKLGPKLDLARGGCASFQIDGPASGPWHYSPSAFPLHRANSHRSSSTFSSSKLTTRRRDSATASEAEAKKNKNNEGERDGDEEEKIPAGWIQGRLLCVVGGFVGTHDRGYSVDLVSCYDRVTEDWVTLPSLPNQLDHHNAVYVKGGTCSGHNRDRVLVLNGRNGPYNMTVPEIHQLVLGDDHWTTWLETSPSHNGAASVSLTKQGHLISVGGIEYPTGHVEVNVKSDEINILNVCSKTYCKPRSTLLHPKWALYPCHSPRDDYLYICGGASTFHDSHRNSPYCEAINIPLLESECHQSWLPAPTLQSLRR